jgi:rhamnogalacturonyl hydrolase YesR
MKNQLKPAVALAAAVLLLVGCRHCCTCSSGHAAAAPIPPAKILAAMQSVADWQLANPATNAGTGWIPAVSDAGFMALAGISGDVKYRDAMLAMGETNNWQLGSLLYDADGHCIGQTYAELYALYRERRMIAPLREKFDAILAQPSAVSSLQFDRSSRATQGKSRENWSWCDSLFMGPPTWVRLASLTGDSRYLDFAVANWWRTTDYLYDKDQHLFSRDSSYFDKKETNGKKVFWSRGNGWVMAGLVRTLQYLPTNHPDRPRFERLFKDLAGAVLASSNPMASGAPASLIPSVIRSRKPAAPPCSLMPLPGV